MRISAPTEIVLLAPLFLAMLGLVVLPFLLLLGGSFFGWTYGPPQGGPTLANYQHVLGSPITWKVFVNSLTIAVPVTLLSVAGGYLLAYRIVFVPGPVAQILFVMTITALMASYIVRVYAWRTLLGTNGVINGALIGLGIADGPADLLLFSSFAVVLAMVSMFLPLAALTFFAALAGIDPTLHEAARDLGAGRAQTFLRVTVPLAGSTLLTTTALIYFLAFGDYITPVFVGGPGSVGVGRIIADNFGPQPNYGRGAAMSVLLALSFVVFFVLLRAALVRLRMLPARVA
jgi:spermidine/putrescine transport system permease protein